MMTTPSWIESSTSATAPARGSSYAPIVLTMLVFALGFSGVTWEAASASMRDGETTKAVARTLEADERLTSDAIRVETVDGTVYLSGIATSFGERQHAEDLARSVPGVRAVVNDVRIVPPALDVAPSPFDEWAHGAQW